MTHPQQGRGAPPFEHVAQDAIASARGERTYQRPYVQEPVPLTEAEKAAAAEAERAAAICSFCAGYHALPGTQACPRLASFKLNGDGKVESGTYFEGTGWAEGRVVFVEEVHENGDENS